MIERGACRRLSEQLLHIRIEILPAVDVHDGSHFIHKPHHRDAVDSELRADLIFPALAVEKLRQPHGALRGECLQLSSRE